MKVADQFHLTYCSNIHPGESWDDVSRALAASLPGVRRSLDWSGPLGVGLRLSAAAAVTLEHPEVLAAFRRFLADGDYYVFTINGFPYGAFHGQRVKEQVYLPDWRDAARVDYTNRLARLLAALLADRPDIDGSISTVPGAFRRTVTSEADETAIAMGMLRHAAHLVSLRTRTGTTIALAVEPEPACYLETIEDAVSFFRGRLFDGDLIARIVRETGVAFSVDDVRRHVGVCVDACHMAVEFEDPVAAFASLREAGIRICKAQLSSAIAIDNGRGEAVRRALAPFAEDTYLHQVVERCATGVTRYTDLPEALEAAVGRASHDGCDWRVHFHVPIVLAAMDGFSTTQSYLGSVLDLLKRDPVCRYLEVETYTWHVLPPEYRTGDICSDIGRELAWVKARLEA